MHTLALVAFILSVSCSFVSVLAFLTGVANICLALILMTVKGIRPMFGRTTGAPSSVRKESISLGKGFFNLGVGVALIVVAMVLMGVAIKLAPDLWRPL